MSRLPTKPSVDTKTAQSTPDIARRAETTSGKLGEGRLPPPPALLTRRRRAAAVVAAQEKYLSIFEGATHQRRGQGIGTGHELRTKRGRRGQNDAPCGVAGHLGNAMKKARGGPTAGKPIERPSPNALGMATRVCGVGLERRSRVVRGTARLSKCSWIASLLVVPDTRRTPARVGSCFALEGQGQGGGRHVPASSAGALWGRAAPFASVGAPQRPPSVAGVGGGRPARLATTGGYFGHGAPSSWSSSRNARCPRRSSRINPGT